MKPGKSLSQSGRCEAVEYDQLIPVLGQICAGKNMGLEYLPILRWRKIRRPKSARPDDQLAAAEICGDSLSEAGIHHGDYAIIILGMEVRPGDLAAVLTPEGMLIKFVYPETDDRIRLEGANEDYPPLWYETLDIIVQGRVVRIERDL